METGHDHSLALPNPHHRLIPHLDANSRLWAESCWARPSLDCYCMTLKRLAIVGLHRSATLERFLVRVSLVTGKIEDTLFSQMLSGFSGFGTPQKETTEGQFTLGFPAGRAHVSVFAARAMSSDRSTPATDQRQPTRLWFSQIRLWRMFGCTIVDGQNL